MNKFRFQIFYIVALLTGCGSAEDTARQKNTALDLSDYVEPGFAKSIQIAAPFRLQFEESSIEFCASPVSADAPKCPGPSQRCWLVFDDNANDDLSALTNRSAFATEGLYWLEGSGKQSVSENGFGHLGQYSCQVEMTKIERFRLISGTSGPLR